MADCATRAEHGAGHDCMHAPESVPSLQPNYISILLLYLCLEAALILVSRLRTQCPMFAPSAKCLFKVHLSMQGYAVNVPLTDGLDDEMFVHDVFMPVIDGVMEHYRPSVIVLQCGADSLAGDKIGKFNLSTLGHAEAGRYLRHMYPNVPVMMLGGGGYTISNVARTWSYETMAMLGYQDEQIPYYCPIVRSALP